MALNLIEHAEVSLNTAIIKFGRTIKISSLKNENFVVETVAATPNSIVGPFLPINSIVDYNQISRTLTLYWDTVLQSETEYKIRVINFLDAANELIPEEQVLFATTEAATPSSFSSIRVPDIQEVYIEDHSIRMDAYTSVQIIAKNPNFYIVDTVPANGDFYIDNAFSNGRVTITFSARPASNFLNNFYFKAQKKKIQRSPSRWESVGARVSMHSWKPEVYVDFPSDDATPVFNEENSNYYESGYKYRVIVSKDVGV